MAYQFSAQKVASVKFQGLTSDNGALNIANVNGQLTNADTMVNGVKGLLWIGGLENAYDPEDAIRTVKQSVVEE